MFLLRRQRGTPEMPLRAVPWLAGVVTCPHPLCLSSLGDETHALRVIDIVTTVEQLGPALWPFKDLLKIGYRAVMEIGRPDPQGIERHIDIPTGGAKMLKMPGIFVGIGVVGLRRFGCPHLGTVRISVQRAWEVRGYPSPPQVIGERQNLSGFLAVEAVATSTMFLKDWRTRGCEFLIDRKEVGEPWWLQIRRPRLKLRERFERQGRRGRLVTDGGAQDHLSEIGVQAVPVKGHFMVNPGTEIPQGFHVRIANGVANAHIENGDLDRIERINPPPAPVRSSGGPSPPLFLLEEGFAGRRNEDKAVHEAIEERQASDRANLIQNMTRRKSWVAGTGEEETLIAQNVHGIPRSSQIDVRHCLALAADPGRMAQRTVDPNAFKANCLLTKTYG